MGIRKFLNESSISRIWQFIEDDSKKFGVISAFRKGNSDNEENHRKLKEELRKLKYGYIDMKGGYNEEEGGIVIEKSLFIPNIDKKTLIKLGTLFNQDSVLYKDENEFNMIGTNKDTGIGKTLATFKKGKGKENIVLAKEAMKEFFSELVKGSHRGKKFLFNLLEYREMGSLMRMGGYNPYWFSIVQDDVVINTITKNHLNEEEFSPYTSSKSFFISPKGELIAGSSSHINVITDHPEKFGLSIDDIRQEYEKYHERMGIEGRAREEIIVDLLKHGWVHIRRRPNYWAVMVGNVTPRILGNLEDFAKKIVKGVYGVKETNKWADVKINSVNTSYSKNTSLDVLSKGKIQENKENIYELKVCYITDLEDIK